MTSDTPGPGEPRPPDPELSSALLSIVALLFIGSQVSTILSNVGESV